MSPGAEQGSRAGAKAQARDGASDSDVRFHYAAMFQRPPSGTVGTYAYLRQATPHVDDGDFHSLAEVAAQGGAGDGQIVEVGWTVDRQTNHDDLPHIFVYHWVDGRAGCYNGCGYVQVSTTVRPGQRVDPAQPPQAYAIQYFDGNWWVGVGGVWMGYFPGSLWGGRFTEVGLAQWFGEVAAGVHSPMCTQMGDGQFGFSPAAATITRPTLIDTGNHATPATPGVSLTDPSAYNVDEATGGFGGPGACPDTWLTTAPPSPTRQARPTFAFASDDPAATFECAIDPPAGRFVPCPGGSFRPGRPLRDGRHAFAVRARGAQGVDPQPAQARFTVEATPPRLRVRWSRRQRTGGRWALVSVRCSKSCELRYRATLTIRHGSRTFAFTIGRQMRRLPRSRPATFWSVPSPRLRARILGLLGPRGAARVAVQLLATDAAGNTRAITLRARLLGGSGGKLR